jgi:hypothetical protein
MASRSFVAATPVVERRADRRGALLRIGSTAVLAAVAPRSVAARAAAVPVGRPADAVVAMLEEGVGGAYGGGPIRPILSGELIASMRRRPHMYLPGASMPGRVTASPSAGRDAVDAWVAEAVVPRMFGSVAATCGVLASTVDIAADGRVELVEHAAPHAGSDALHDAAWEWLVAYGRDVDGWIEPDGTRRTRFRADPAWFPRTRPHPRAVLELIARARPAPRAWGRRIEVLDGGIPVGAVVFDRPSDPSEWRDEPVARRVA